MAPFDFNEFEKKMNKASRRIEQGLNKRAGDFERRMDDFRKRMEDVGKRANTQEINIPGMHKSSTVTITKNGKTTIIKDGVVIRDDNGKISISGSSAFRVYNIVKTFLFGVIVITTCWIAVTYISHILQPSGKPKPLDVKPPTMEQTMPSPPEHSEVEMKKKL